MTDIAEPMTLDHSATPPAPSRPQSLPRWPRIVLIIAAVVETMSGLSDLPILFGDISEIPGSGIGGWIITAKIATAPFLAAAAVIFAGMDRVRFAIIAIAGLVFMNWLNFMPSVVRHGFELSGGWTDFQTLFQIILFPLMAVMALALALRNERLPLAAGMMVAPTIYSWLAVIAFGIGVSIYGF